MTQTARLRLGRGFRAAASQRGAAQGSGGLGLQEKAWGWGDTTLAMWLWVNNRTPNGTLASGNMDQNLWSPGGLSLTHTHVNMGHSHDFPQAIPWKLPNGPLWKTWFRLQDRPSGSFQLGLREGTLSL